MFEVLEVIKLEPCLEMLQASQLVGMARNLVDCTIKRIIPRMWKVRVTTPLLIT
jgi:hypothetical protein